MKKFLLSILSLFCICGCGVVDNVLDSNYNDTDHNQVLDDSYVFNYEEVSEYEGQPYIELNNNMPVFDEEDLNSESFEYYSELDDLGRCQVVYANLSQELMPDEKRGDIYHIKPTGWQSIRYDFIEGESLYNRCHLIAHSLAGENDNEKNLITGTSYLNREGMLPFEEKICNYIDETNNHVLYRVTPVFVDDDLVARGVIMEAYSIEDNGEGICFNVYCYNVQPDMIINYDSGTAYYEEELDELSEKVEVRGNTKSKVYHMPDQSSYDDMEHSRYLIIFDCEKDAIDAGYRQANVK